jgi:hypothetical protein
MEKAEHLVEQLWELPLRRTELGQPEGISMMEMHQRRITEGLRLLGKNAVPALILGLEDPDAQMRRNAALILWDLAGGLSNVAQPRLDCREALPALTKALTDSDLSVKEWAGAAIAAIRLAEASNNQKQP